MSRLPTVLVGAPERRIPRSFLGISVEWNELASFQARPALMARFLSLLRVAGQPVSLRIGGKSADSVFLPGVGPRRLPRGAFRPGRRFFAHLATLVRDAHARLIVDLNLAARSPAMAAALARRLRRLLPRGALEAFEIGNEPDLYPRGTIGLVPEAVGRFGPFAWARRYSPSDYAASFRAYARALRSAWPGARLAGPALSSAHLAWPRAVTRRDAGELSLLTLHRYAYGGCTPRSSPSHPTVARYLQDTSSMDFVHKLAPWVAFARRQRIALRLTELGSASCGGLRGATNTFATALWGTDTFFDLLAAGVDGINVHLRLHRPNSALTAVPGGILAHPLFYGMLLFTATLGPGAQLMHTSLSPPAGVNLRVWAVRDARGVMRVLLIDKSSRPATVLVRLDSRQPGELVRLTATSPAATAGERLAGLALTRSGRWTGRARFALVRPQQGAYPLSVPAASAALLTVKPPR